MDQEGILKTEQAGLGILTFNRPQALNALTLDMIRVMAQALTGWQDAKAITAILFRNQGGRAFCAGGDIKAAYQAGLAYKGGDPRQNPAAYFAEEYALDRQIYHYPKPTVAFMDGIVMGGGFGLAGPCRYRVATENTKFAMPEVGIGFFPDVGSAYFLNGCPGQLGTYLALTGGSLGPADILAAGLATHYVPSALLNECAAALETGDADAIPGVFDRFAAKPSGGEWAARRAVIDHCFAFDSVREIMQALDWDGSDFARATYDAIASRAPLSVKVTLAHLRQAKTLDFDSVIARDFTLAQHFLADHDFYEGVRAAVIDKDRAPHWQPATLDEVLETELARYNGPAASALADFIAAI